MLNPLEGLLALASLAAFLRPPRWAPALLLAGPLAAAQRGEATSPLYAPLPLAFSRDKLSLLHGFLVYLASSPSPPPTGLPVWRLALYQAAGLLLALAPDTPWPRP